MALPINPVAMIRRLAAKGPWQGLPRRRRLVISGLLVACLVGMGGILVGAASADFLVGLFKAPPMQAESVPQ